MGESISSKSIEVFCGSIFCKFVVWTLYYHPRDFPEFIVCRGSVAINGRPVPMAFACLYESIEHARADLARLGLVRFVRQEGDDPVIIESWM